MPFRLCFLAFLLLLSCTKRSNNHAEETIVKVDDHVLTAKEFASELVFRLKTYDSVLVRQKKVINQAKEQIINEFIIATIVKKWAKKENIIVTSDEIQQDLDRVLSQYPDKSSFVEALSREGLTQPQWIGKQKQSLLQRKVFASLATQVNPTSDREIKLYYEQRKSEFKQPAAIKLRQIVFDSEAAARQIRKKVVSRAIGFNEAAKKYSISPEAKNEGLVGWVEKGIIETFDKAFELPRKRVSKVHQSPYGWHIFLIEGKRPEKPLKLSDVREDIKKKLRLKKEQAKFTDWLDNQIRLATVLVDEKLVEAVMVEIQQEK